jgi:hypothetical protein
VLEAVGPFLFGAFLLVAGSLVGKIASRRAVKRYETEWAKLPANAKTIGLNPATMSNMIDWATDSTQILGIFVGPLIGLIFLAGDVGLLIVLCYVALLIVAFLATLWFVTAVKPVDYWEKPLGPVIRGKLRGIRSWRSLSSVTIIGISINLAAAAAAAALTL